MNLFKPDMQMVIGLLVGVYAVPWIIKVANR